ncbi:MAG TPA: rRNA maturation RNase YbeY [Alphaproteobacteria bacterium]|nr:rRNA maturation RNase YbeY [Alphaproteobacteria bacterium]
MSRQPPLHVAVSIESDGWPEGLEALAERAVRAALARTGARVAGPAEVSILLTDDAHQRDLNRQWRQLDKPTNVLSFPQLAPFSPLAGLVGDISLARETLAREAAELGVAFSDHFTHLVVHGFLHLLGYDHVEESEAEQMESLETEVLAGLGIADPYADG